MLEHPRLIVRLVSSRHASKRQCRLKLKDRRGNGRTLSVDRLRHLVWKVACAIHAINGCNVLRLAIELYSVFLVRWRPRSSTYFNHIIYVFRSTTLWPCIFGRTGSEYIQISLPFRQVYRGFSLLFLARAGAAKGKQKEETKGQQEMIP